MGATNRRERLAGGKLESVNGTRFSEYRSNQRPTGRYLRGWDPVLAFAYRVREPGPRLWITGPAAGTERRGPAAQWASLAGYSLERGVHSLWIRLLIRLWGRWVNSQ